jgi:hypothetical protein
MSKVRSVIKLHTEGVSKLSIGELTCLPSNTVKKYIRLFLASGLSLEEVERMDEAVLEKLFLDITRQDCLIEDPRYQTLISLFPDIDKKLKRRENCRKKLWKEYLVNHPNGYQLTTLKMHYRWWKKGHNSPRHIEPPAGEKTYLDYAGEKLKYLDPFSGEV